MTQRISWKARFSSLLTEEGLNSYDRNVIEDMKRGYDRRGSGYMSPARKRYFLALEARAAATTLAMEQRAAQGKSDLAIRLENVQGYINHDSSWAAAFVKSLIEQERQRGSLSSKQMTTLSKIESENNADTVKTERDWYARFATDQVLQLQWHRAMVYYRANGPYHSGLVANWFDHGELPDGRMGTEIAPIDAPPHKAFNKVIANNYIQKVLAGYTAPPAFEAGAMVALRASANFTAQSKTAGRPCVVMTNELDIITASKGNRRYRLLPVGSTQTFEIQEKHIKNFKLPKNKRKRA
jgi:hypothetical protein